MAAGWVLPLATLWLLYSWAVRPVLRRTPALESFWQTEDNAVQAVKAKFAGLKTLIAARASIVLVGYIGLHDFVAAHSGDVDWTPLTSHIPGWAWPILVMADLWVIMKLREFTDRRKHLEKWGQ